MNVPCLSRDFRYTLDDALKEENRNYYDFRFSKAPGKFGDKVSMLKLPRCVTKKLLICLAHLFRRRKVLDSCTETEKLPFTTW